MHFVSVAVGLKSIFSGVLVGFILGLIGGGGSILAVPLLVYFVGYAHRPHTAIGTTAVAVAVNALIAAIPHLKARQVSLRVGAVFAASGVLGAALGSRLGLIVSGQRLLLLFALLMILISLLMWRRSSRTGAETAHGAGRRGPTRWGKVTGVGFSVGAASGFFGIGGGFLIVPGLIMSAGLTTAAAVGTSLLSVFAFGMTTAIQYGLAGKVDLTVAALFVVGGLLGGNVGGVLSRRIGSSALSKVFSVFVFLVAIYMISKIVHPLS